MTRKITEPAGQTRRGALRTLAAGAGAAALPLWARYAQAQTSEPIRVGFQVHRTGIGAAYGRWYDRTTQAACCGAQTRGMNYAEGKIFYQTLDGQVFALDAETGEHYWTYDAFAAVWGSAFVADGKVYLGDEDGDVAILKAGKEMELLDEVNLGSAVYTTPVARDGVLYIASRNMLFALQEGAQLAAE